MKKTTSFLAFIFALSSLFAQDIPANTNKRINDFAGIIPDEKENELTNIALKMEDQSSAQLAVVTINGVSPDYPIEEYSLKLAQTWGIGQKGVDNGCLILILPDRREFRIEVGYGLEGVFTDFYTKRLQNQYFIPNFRNGDYFTGIQQVMTDMVKELSPEMIAQKKAYAEQQAKERAEFWSSFWDIIVVILFFGAIILAVVMHYVAKKREQEKREAERKQQEKLETDAIDAKTNFETFFSNLKSKLDPGFLNTKTILENLEKSAVIAKQDAVLLDVGEIPSYYKNIEIEMQKQVADVLKKKEIRDKVYGFNSQLESHRSGYENKFLTAKTILLAMIAKYSDVIFEGDPQKEIFDVTKFHNYKSKLNFELDKITSIKSAVDDQKFDLAQENYANLINNLSKISSVFEYISVKEKAVTHAVEFVGSAAETVRRIIANALSDINHSYTNSSTKTKFKTFVAGIDYEQLALNQVESPLIQQQKVEKVIKELNSIIQSAKDEIAAEKRRIEEEERRKKRQREEDEARRRRNSSSSSSSIGFGGGGFGSSGGGSSFGGGSFGGGGSSGRW